MSDSNTQTQSTQPPLIPILRGIGGAIFGAFLGYLLAKWCGEFGYKAMVIPGAFLGLGFGLASQYRNLICGIVCGVAGLAWGVTSEWLIFPFVADGSFTFFLQHLGDLSPPTWLMIGMGALMSFWFGRGR